jgi:hypothetical protein
MRLRFDRLGNDERGIQWTLEAFFAVLLLLSALIVVLESTSLDSPQSEDQTARSQLSQRGADVFSLASEQGLLHDAILYWNSGGRTYINSTTITDSQGHYTTFDRSDSFPLAALLNETLGEQRLAYNLIIEYENASGRSDTRLLVYQGPPGGDSVTVSTRVTLADMDKPAATPSDCTLREIDSAGVCTGEDYFIPNAHPNDPDLYNIVRVQLEVWR